MNRSLTPASMDNGRSVAQRAWLLSFPHAVVPQDFETKATEGLIFDVQAKWLGRQRATFDQWNDDGDKLRPIEALFQLFVTGIAKLAEIYMNNNAETYQNPKCPIRVFLETVLCDPEYARNTNDADYDAQETAWVIKQLEEIYDGRVTEAQLRANTSMLDASGKGAPDRVEFMNGYADRTVASYRIWVLIDEAHISLSDAILAVFEGCCKRESERLSHNHPAADAGGPRKRAVPGADVHSGVATEHVADIITPQERHWLINTPSYFLVASSMYLSNHALAINKDDRAYSARTPIKNGQNEVHPSKTFGIMPYFADCARRRTDIDVCQRTLDRYYNANTRTWSFRNARANCVLWVGAEHWRNRNLLTMYTPDYQRRNIEPRLTWRQRSHRMTADVAAFASPAAVAAQPRVSNASNNNSASAIGGSSMAEDNDDDDDSEVSAMEMTFRPAIGGAIAGAMVDAEDDSSADLAARIAEHRAALAVPAQRQRDIARDMAAIAPPSRAVPVLTAAELEKLEREEEEQYRRTLQMGFQDSRSRQRAEDLANSGSLGGTSATVCHELRVRYFLKEAQEIEAIVDDDVRLRERLRMSLRAIDEYAAKATGPHSNVSGPHQAMNSWAMEERRLDRLRFLRETRFVDPRLSYFAQSVIAVYSDAERLCAMHTSHDVLFLLYVSSRSALLYDRDKLRNNVLLFGEHATSKSYALTELCKKMLIPGTFISVTSQSRQAANTDTHTNDLVVVHEELQQSLISKHTKESEMQDTFKDMLTRGASTRLLCFIADNGRRQQIVSNCEKNMCLIAACNSKRKDISDPIADRMILCQQVPRNRIGISIGQTMSGGHDRSHRRHVEIAEMQHDYALRQFIYNEVEKNIMTGGISDPHLVCFAPIYSFYEKVLKSEFSINVQRRQIDQLRMMLRTLIIMSAIERLYNSPAGLCYGKRYSPAHLLLMEPMLHDDEELVYMVLDMCRHMLVDPNQEALIEFWRTYYIPAIIGQQVPSLHAAFEARTVGSTSQTATVNDEQADVDGLAAHLDNLTTTTTTSSDAESVALTQFFRGRATTAKSKSAEAALPTAADTEEPSEQSAADALVANIDSLAGMTQQAGGGKKASAKTQKAAAAPSVATELNYNYFVFPKKLDKLCDDIAANMAKIRFRRAMSAETIKDVLLTMTKQAIPTKTYRRAPPGHWPPVCVETSSARMRVTNMQMQISEDGHVSLHSLLAFFERGSPHEHAIACSMNRYTPTGFFVAGRPVSDQIPHLVYVRRALQTPRIPTYIDSANMHRGLGMSYNQYSTKVRLEWLGVPTTRSEMAQFDPICNDAYARSLPDAVVDRPVVYPDDPIKAGMLAVRQNNDLQQFYDAGVTTDAYGNRLRQEAVSFVPKRRALSSRAAGNAQFAVPDAYQSRQVFTDADYHNATADKDSAIYDREKLGTINLAVYNDPCIEPAASSSQAPSAFVAAAPESPKPKWPVYDPADDDIDGAAPRRQPYTDVVDQTARIESLRAQGNRQLLVSEVTNNMPYPPSARDANEDDSTTTESRTRPPPPVHKMRVPWAALKRT